MAKYPAMLFYPKDWLADEAVRSCPAFARGIWIDMLMIMHSCEPYGYLTINGGEPMPIEMLARRIGESKTLLGKALGTLESAHVFSRDSAGRIYCKRMVRDQQRSEAGKRSAEKRWNRGNLPQTIPDPNGLGNGLPNGHRNGEPNGEPNGNASTPYQEEEKALLKGPFSSSKNAARIARVDDARSQRSEPPDDDYENEEMRRRGITRKLAAAIDAQVERDRQEHAARLKKDPPVPTFEEFWAAYPRDNRSSEENCRKIWNTPALCDYDHRAAVEGIAILLAWVNEAPSDPEREIPTAEFWLSRRRGSAMMARFPQLNPNAREKSGEQPESENPA
jgi:hypothetical protein